MIDQVLSKVEENKRNKRAKLLNSAYELFSSVGFRNTTIDDITNNAGVAKGTFYLFFKNKFDIREQLTLNEAFKTIEEVLNNFDFDSSNAGPADNFIDFIDKIIDILKNDKERLTIINKNLSWGAIKTYVESNDIISPKYELISSYIKRFFEKFANETFSKDEMPLVLFSLLEMIGGVAYYSIMEGIPKPIEEMKPTLFKTVRLVLE